MSRSRFPRQLVLLASLALVISAGLAACSSSAGTATNDGRFAAAQASAAAAEPAAGGSTDSKSQAQLVSEQQRIVKTGEITLEVESVANGLSRVRAMAIELGGYVGGSQAGTLDQSATLTLRIPAARFDDALSRLHEIGSKVLSESTREEDVTSSIVDLEARLKNLEASEAQYRLLMAKATKIDDILAVQSRLDDVQGQIEQLSAQLKALGDQADLSTLTVTLQPRAQPIQAASSTWDPGDTASSAVGALLQVGQALVTAGIWIGIVGLPLLIALAILLLILIRFGIIRRSSAPRVGAGV